MGTIGLMFALFSFVSYHKWRWRSHQEVDDTWKYQSVLDVSVLYPPLAFFKALLPNQNCISLPLTMSD